LIDKSTTFDRIAIRTSSSYSGTATVRLGIYNNTSGIPATLVLDAGTVSCTAASTVYEITINQTLTAGFYWLAFCQQGTEPGSPNYTGIIGSAATGNPYLPAAASPLGTLLNGYYQSSVTGAFATATSLVNNTGLTPTTWVRTA
jgi:hypothetical protein